MLVLRSPYVLRRGQGWTMSQSRGQRKKPQFREANYFYPRAESGLAQQPIDIRLLELLASKGFV